MNGYLSDAELDTLERKAFALRSTARCYVDALGEGEDGIADVAAGMLREQVTDLEALLATLRFDWALRAEDVPTHDASGR